MVEGRPLLAVDFSIFRGHSGQQAGHWQWPPLNLRPEHLSYMYTLITSLNMAIYCIYIDTFEALSCVAIKLESKRYFKFKINCISLL